MFLRNCVITAVPAMHPANVAKIVHEKNSVIKYFFLRRYAGLLFNFEFKPFNGLLSINSSKYSSLLSYLTYRHNGKQLVVTHTR